MTVQTSKGKVSHTYKKLIKRITTFEYKKLLLLLKSPQNKAASNIVITEKKQNKSDISFIPGNYEIKLLI